MEKLEVLADQIGKAGIAAAIITLVALILRLLIKLFAQKVPWDSQKHPAEIVRAVIIAVRFAHSADHGGRRRHSGGTAAGSDVELGVFGARNAQGEQLGAQDERLRNDGRS